MSLQGALGPARGSSGGGSSSGSGVVALGTGDGSTAAYALPSTGLSGLLLFVGGILQPGSVFNISRGTGPSGADQVVLDAAPAVGAPVEAFWVS